MRANTLDQAILFLCPHNAAKSVIAVAYFNQLAQQLGLPFVADSAGTEPSDVVSPVVTEMLTAEGFDVSHHLPRLVTWDDLQSAERIISMGCTAEELQLATEQVELWQDVPMVSQQPEQAHESIRTHVRRLIAELQVK